MSSKHAKSLISGSSESPESEEGTVGKGKKKKKRPTVVVDVGSPELKRVKKGRGKKKSGECWNEYVSLAK